MKVSLLVPVFNEAESLPQLYDELAAVCDGADWEAEILFVDDGSTDASWAVLSSLGLGDARVRTLRFARNFGQTAAMAAAIEHATGDVLVPLDADLQNDPADVPRLLKKLGEGYDVVSGWRRHRRDQWLTRKLPSRMANFLISRWTGVRLHDYGCTLKAYRAGVLRGTKLYGEMHRFVPVYAAWRGARVTELEVNHRARRYGRSKYGLGRTFKVLLDMITIKFLGSFSTKPSYLFGGLGALFIAIALLTFAGVVLEKVLVDAWPHKMSALLFTTFSMMVGVVLVMMGLLAELIVRTWHESQDKPTYVLWDEIHPRRELTGELTSVGETDASLPTELD